LFLNLKICNMTQLKYYEIMNIVQKLLLNEKLV
jgi:hypothetical protein